MNSDLEIRFIIAKSRYDLLEQAEKELLNLAALAMQNAYAPYSNYAVGAAVRLSNNQVVIGANQENAAYPSGICAERIAVFSAMAQFPNEQILEIAITTEIRHAHPVAPCGACRQVIAEYELKQSTPIKLILGHTDGEVWISASMENLLPLPFKLLDK